MSSQDMFTTGTDTTHTILEWAMAELTRHPRVINKSQSEGRGIVASKTDREDDLVEMHYLKDVIKETLQLHPSVPLLIPRLSTGDVKIHGCNIKAKTQVLVNTRMYVLLLYAIIYACASFIESNDAPNNEKLGK
ncbi:cytochrome P450 736A117-like [Malus domestica]|uniref:cytochrome P450 736A117-like n=1 Tax=Malus domestica TaxID=3750 RepID=UPI0039756CF8